jgi:hypothetical protein
MFKNAMDKSAVTHLSLFLMMGTLIMLVPFTNITFSNAKAQEYGVYVDDDYTYSKYPTEVNKYECRTGPFEGFFVSSVEFCKHVKFDNDKDDRKDNNITGTQGPPGPHGIQGPPGSTGATGATGPAGITQLINGSNVYLVEASDSGISTTASGLTLQAFASCDAGDFVLNGGFDVIGTFGTATDIDDYPNKPIFSFDTQTWGWITVINVVGDAELTLNVDAYCFDNPPLRS